MPVANSEEANYHDPWLYRLPNTPPASGVAWQRLTSAEYDFVWDILDEKFEFNPCVNSRGWTGILEPVPSVTYAIGSIYDGSGRYQSLYADLHNKTLNVFKQILKPGEMLYALDWHHVCYYFQPHFPFMLGAFEGDFNPNSDNYWDKALELGYQAQPGQWPVPVLPNGDYYIFLALDFSWGIFGHPWEQTMCLFGQPLVEAFEQPKNKPLLFDTPIRRNTDWLVDWETYYAARDEAMRRH